MCAEHEIRQNHAEPENGNCSLKNRAEHEIRQNRAKHDFLNCSLKNRVQHEIRQNNFLSKSHMTSDVVHVPINYIRNHHYDFLNCSLKNLMRLLMFDELVITISCELRSCFQFNYGNNNK